MNVMKDIREDPGTLKAIQLLVSLWVIGQIILTLSKFNKLGIPFIAPLPGIRWNPVA